MKRPSLPGLMFITRNDRPTPRVQGDGYRIPAQPVKVNIELAPKPPDDTAWYGVGRDPQHTWTQREVNNQLNIAFNHSVMAPCFLPGMPARRGSFVVQMPRGQFVPAVGRPNIETPDKTTYGQQTTLSAPQVYAPPYAKLMTG